MADRTYPTPTPEEAQNMLRDWVIDLNESDDPTNPLLGLMLFFANVFRYTERVQNVVTHTANVRQESLDIREAAIASQEGGE